MICAACLTEIDDIFPEIYTLGTGPALLLSHGHGSCKTPLYGDM